MASLLTCSLPFQLIINKYLYFRLHDMLRTGLVKMDGGKVASVESELRSVSLRQVTPIIVVLASGVLTAILIGVVERLKAQHCEWRDIGTLITNKTFKPANLTFLNTSQCACCDQTCKGGFPAGVGGGYSFLITNTSTADPQWTRCIRRRSAATHLLGLRVRITPETWIYVYCECWQVELCKLWYSHYRPILHLLLLPILWYPQIWWPKTSNVIGNSCFICALLM